MQPIETVNGRLRFKPNALVDHLYNQASKGIKCDMNDLAYVACSPEDRMQFAQLIGYSLNGYSELSYVTDEAYGAACKVADNPEVHPAQAELDHLKEMLHSVRVGMREAIGELYGKHPDDLIEVEEEDVVSGDTPS